jgi:diacylglycerol kinase family enzyme
VAVGLIVNPVATRAGAAARAAVVRALTPAGLERVLVTRGAGDAARLARELADDGVDAVVTLGGDGTAADVAGALAGGPVALAPLPGGNANVFARALGWPARLEPALAALTGALAAGRRRDAALGRITADGTERVFAINAGVGLDAATVEWIEARPRTKRRLRQAGFVLGAAAAALGPRAPLWVSADDDAPERVVALLAACGSPYTYLGRRPLDLVPGAAFDGRVAWVGLTRARPGEIARIAARAARGRDLPLGGPAMRGGDVGRVLRVRGEGPAPVQADGEPLGRHEEVTIAPGPVLVAVDPVAPLKSGPPGAMGTLRDGNPA